MAETVPSLSAFLTRCDVVAAGLGLKRSTLSTRIFRDGKSLTQLHQGRDIGVRRLAKAEAELAELEDEARRRARTVLAQAEAA
jgi:hypothetical protein